MKQRKLCASDISSGFNECNGHVRSFKQIKKDEIRCTNGNRCRNFKIKTDKPTDGACIHEPQTMSNRSQWCLIQNNTVQTSFQNAPIYSKFAFHRIVPLIVILLFTGCCVAANGQQTDSQFNAQNIDIFNIHKSHYVIQPTIFDGKNQRKILASTRQTDGSHVSHIILEYTHLDTPNIADLFLNQRLLTDTHFLRTQNTDGTTNIQTFNRTNSNICHYQGQLRNNTKSKVVLSTCNGIKGMVYDGQNMYAIHPNDIGSLHEPHYLFSQNQIDESHPLVMNSVYAEPNIASHVRKQKVKRAVTESTAREPYNANKQSSFVELVIVVDNDVYKEMNENLDKIHQYCKDIANIINSLYVPLNIFVALVGVVVWTEKNEIELSNDGDKTLKNFLNYRRKVLIKDHPNDNAQLLTKVQFDGGVVGKALKGPICTYEFSGGVSTYHSPIVGVVATTIAHEMGHNFGMEHDTVECKCEEERCIMSASSSSIAPTHWSECSIHQLNLAIHQGMNHCLRNIPSYLFDPPTCGNGFVEAGEECDCGLPSVCSNTCCNPTTCKLHSNATCATGKCCDLDTCQLHEAGHECRSSAGECDLPEYCDGNSEFCPVDYFKRDTEVCEGGKAFCYNGLCKSRDDQCKVLWGPSGKSSEQCYEKNLDGTRHGNCGYNRSSNVYKNCTRENIFCGMLQCRHLNERLEFGLESVAVLSHSFITYGGNIIPCRTAVIDLGLETVDPGLAPDGSKCDDGKMCIKQKCIPIDVLRKDGKVKDCQSNCNDHGVCDNLGHCHCDKGFAPPNCDSPGPGGSLHSGPATNPYAGYGFVRVLYVFFLGVVPSISLSLLLFHFWRKNRPWFISQSANDMKISVRHYPDRPPPPPPSASLSQLSPSSTDDMNATLLKSSTNTEEPLKRELFGSFKGFSLKPLPMTKPSIVGASNVAYVHPVAKTELTNNEQCIPTRVAPLPPMGSPKKFQIKSSPKSSPSSYRYQNINDTAKESPETPIEVKLFGINSDAKERPKISHPVLENSTVSVKELIATANLTQVPKINKATLPTSNKINVAQKPNNSSTKHENGPIDKGSLKKLDISAPIKSVSFGRSQSMRSPSNEKAQIKRNAVASGSMRYPAGAKRPTVVDRPKNPPPPRPPGNLTSASASLRNIYANTHDEDTLQSNADSTDNIYCVIEEVKESPPRNGLLSEIVNEIENRNLDSIYSTSKNQRKKQETEKTAYENVNKPATIENGKTENIQKFDTQSGNIYMNTATVTEPASKKTTENVKSSNETSKSCVASMAKKLSTFGNAKPTIAAKPTVSNVVNSKNTIASNKEASQNGSVKKPYSKPTNSSSKPTIHATSSVRMMHKRFENRNA